MSIQHQRTVTYADASSNRISLVDTIASNVERNIDKALSIGTDVLLAYAVTRANLAALCLSSDVDCTVKTNSSGSPTDTIALKAGQVLSWVLATDGIARCPFTADVTALYVTNVAAAAFKLRSLATA